MTVAMTSALAAGWLFGSGAVMGADLPVGPGQAYTTIGAAVAEAMPGDVIVVAPGEYVEDLDLSSSGARGAPIRIEAMREGMAVLVGSIDLGGSDWELVGLTVQVPPGSGDGISVDGSRNLFLRLDLSGGDRDGIDGSGTDNTVQDSVIHGFDAGDADAHCIVLNPGAERWTIAGNELFDCSGDGVQLYADGPTRTILDTTIEDNLIYYTGAIVRTENAVDVKDADGLVIRRNVMWGFPENKTLVFQKGPANIEVTCNVMSDGFTGVEFRAEDGGTVENIVFAHNSMTGFTQYALKFDGVIGADVHDNTFVGIDGDGLRLEGLSVQAALVRNNLWVSTTQIESDGDVTADHNGYWMVDDVQIGSDTDVVADPLLDADGRLMAGSPMIDAGVDVGWPFEGAAPDIGWDEVDGGPCGELPAGGDSGDDGGTDGADDTAGGDGPGGDSAAQTGDGAGGTAGGDGPGGEGGEATATSPGGDTSEGQADGDATDGGCGCRTTSRGAGWALVIVPALVAMRRRRIKAPDVS